MARFCVRRSTSAKGYGRRKGKIKSVREPEINKS
jgi:hypothetical protein